MNEQSGEFLDVNEYEWESEADVQQPVVIKVTLTPTVLPTVVLYDTVSYDEGSQELTVSFTSDAVGIIFLTLYQESGTITDPSTKSLNFVFNVRLPVLAEDVGSDLVYRFAPCDNGVGLSRKSRY